ncbi:unnamed protein product [Danaus chrysippus]|uniref:(African queen) hypothetical protein n=1 Tax=Danaus chrysippus TaxID=151541 RepID=A0A8J2VXE9_9NEOP|nr:unnamed protein product [Danaus chrysippus]
MRTTRASLYLSRKFQPSGGGVGGGDGVAVSIASAACNAVFRRSVLIVCRNEPQPESSTKKPLRDIPYRNGTRTPKPDVSIEACAHAS